MLLCPPLMLRPCNVWKSDVRACLQVRVLVLLMQNDSKKDERRRKRR